jgi:hypothetical protein
MKRETVTVTTTTDSAARKVFTLPKRGSVGDPCERCGQNPSTTHWNADSGIMAARGYYSVWCERCCTELQLEHAIERAAAVRKLRARLAKLGGPALRKLP